MKSFHDREREEVERMWVPTGVYGFECLCGCARELQDWLFCVFESRNMPAIPCAGGKRCGYAASDVISFRIEVIEYIFVETDVFDMHLVNDYSVIVALLSTADYSSRVQDFECHDLRTGSCLVNVEDPVSRSQYIQCDVLEITFRLWLFTELRMRFEDEVEEDLEKRCDL